MPVQNMARSSAPTQIPQARHFHCFIDFELYYYKLASMGYGRKSPQYFYRFKSPFGPITLLWSEHGDTHTISRVFLCGPAPTPAHNLPPLVNIERKTSPAIRETAKLICSFLRGNDVTFSLDTVRLDLCPQFQRHVLVAEYAIPRGFVATYQDIARHIGHAGAARAVGRALARNPFPIIIPCHRAIRSDGHLGGYQGGLGMKRRLLEMEGIQIDSRYHVNKPRFFY